MAVPATIISTLLGATARLFALAVALPGRRLGVRHHHLRRVPAGADEAGALGDRAARPRPVQHVGGLVLIHVVQGISFTTLFCRNYYVGIPQELMKAAQVDGAGFFRIFWRIVLPLSPPILIVTVIWQFTGIWNEFLYGVTFSSGAHRPVTAALIALSANIARRRNTAMESAAVLIAAAAHAARLPVRRQVFHARPHRRRGQIGRTMAASHPRRCKRFGPVEVLKGIDSTIDSGEFIVLVGPSGCGKSTLLNIIAGLEKASAGRDRDRRPRRSTASPPKDRDIAMVFQSYALYPDHDRAAEHHLRHGVPRRAQGRAGRGGRPRGAAAADRAAARPQAGQLSGGQRQRVAMGRALVRDPCCSCSTSRCPTSMPSCASRCAWRSSACTSASARPSSTSRTTRSRR